jgi:5-methylcytosine-specific restriction endonuclease McrA
MTTNTITRNMSDGMGVGQITTSDKDEQHYTLERDGCRCQVCGALGYPHDGDDRAMFVYPFGEDVPPTNQITVCDDCLVGHTEEQLDEYAKEMQERQQTLEEDPGDYEQNRERTFERDDYTCQLCGQEGYPKTERGLLAYPVCAGDYHLDNLVTVCNDCITDTLDSDEDDQKAADRLRLQAARAKEWINSDEADTEQPEDIEGHR